MVPLDHAEKLITLVIEGHVRFPGLGSGSNCWPVVVLHGSEDIGIKAWLNLSVHIDWLDVECGCQLSSFSSKLLRDRNEAVQTHAASYMHQENPSRDEAAAAYTFIARPLQASDRDPRRISRRQCLHIDNA